MRGQCQMAGSILLRLAAIGGERVKSGHEQSEDGRLARLHDNAAVAGRLRPLPRRWLRHRAVDRGRFQPARLLLLGQTRAGRKPGAAGHRGGAAQVYAIVRRLALQKNMPEPRIYIIDSPQPNAFATGRSPKKAAVAVTTGILEILTVDELEGVLAMSWPMSATVTS